MTIRSGLLWRFSPPIIRGVGKAVFSLDVSREAELPSPPFVIASNHYSHLDPVVIGSVVGHRVRFLALEDLFGVNRLLDWLVEGYGSIPTPRDRVPVGAVRTALTALEAGEVVGVFPEATRVSHWGTTPPKRGAAWLATRTSVPLVPVAVIGTGKAMGLENRVRRAPIRVVFGAPLQPDSSTTELLGRWTEWTSSQIENHPGSEPSGLPRAFFSGP